MLKICTEIVSMTWPIGRNAQDHRSVERNREGQHTVNKCRHSNKLLDDLMDLSSVENECMLREWMYCPMSFTSISYNILIREKTDRTLYSWNTSNSLSASINFQSSNRSNDRSNKLKMIILLTSFHHFSIDNYQHQKWSHTYERSINSGFCAVDTVTANWLARLLHSLPASFGRKRCVWMWICECIFVFKKFRLYFEPIH